MRRICLGTAEERARCYDVCAATPPATPGGASVASMSSLGGFRSNSTSSSHFPPIPASQYLASRSHVSHGTLHASPGGPQG